MKSVYIEQLENGGFVAQWGADPIDWPPWLYMSRSELRDTGLLPKRKPRRIRKLRTKGRRKNGLKERHR